MVSLINQLKSDIQKLFTDREDSYKNTIVKQKYKSIPSGHYPKIIIEEIDNSEVFSRSTTQGERSTLLGYQISVYCRDTEEHEKTDAVRFLLDVVDNFLRPPTYNMQRIGSPAIIPYISDDTIMTGSQRYTCVYDYETNFIYRN